MNAFIGIFPRKHAKHSFIHVAPTMSLCPRRRLAAGAIVFLRTGLNPEECVLHHEFLLKTDVWFLIFYQRPAKCGVIYRLLGLGTPRKLPGQDVTLKKNKRKQLFVYKAREVPEDDLKCIACAMNVPYFIYIYIYMLSLELNKNSVYLINNSNAVSLNDILRFFSSGFY